MTAIVLPDCAFIVTQDYLSRASERFASKCKINGECLEWMAARIPAGYGKFVVATGGKSSYIYAHRFAYWLKHRANIIGLCVCHKCDNPSCVNPDHLFLGTMAENMQDRDRKGRSGWITNPGRLIVSKKLSENDIYAIRKMLAANYKHRVVARIFGVARSTISDINNGATWRHL